MQPSPKKINAQSGNILIYILGAIFLLGLLAITVKGSSTPGAGIDAEQLAIQVAEVQQYGQELEQAVSYVLANGHSESDIRFAHPDADSAYGDITDDPTRQVFHRSGGGATYRAPPDGSQTTTTSWNFNAGNRVENIGSSCSSDSCTDLIAVLPFVSKDFCLLINERNDILDAAGDPPQDCGNVTYDVPFNGNYGFEHQLADNLGCSGSEFLLGKLEGCFEGETDPPSGTYHYYRVLLAR